MKKVKKDISLKLTFNTYKLYIIFTMFYRFYLEKMKMEKIEKLDTSLHDESKYVIYIRNLKQALNHG